jgi:homoserine O-acetyltransferase
MQYIYKHAHPLLLEQGGLLENVEIKYCTYGTLNAEQNNVVWICHALTANADPEDWWKGFVGEGAVIDTKQYYVVCANILGSCYGSTGPLSINPATGLPYYQQFPQLTIRDMVQAHVCLAQHLSISRIALLIGGSMGGYQAMEWALLQPNYIQQLLLLATSAKESAWGKAIHTAQRIAIEADQTFGNDNDAAGNKGLKAARAIGMLTYRNAALMNLQQEDEDMDTLGEYKASSYLHYQGEKLVARFNAYSYYRLSEAMDTHNIARGTGLSLAERLQQISINTLVIGISSDLLCPVAEQAFIATHIPQAQLSVIDSPYGHDGFLVEYKAIGEIVAPWLLPIH